MDYIQEFKKTYTEAKRRKDIYGDTLGYSQLEGMTEENSVEMLQNAGSDCRYPEFVEALKNYALLDAFTVHEDGEKITNKYDLYQRGYDWDEDYDGTEESKPDLYYEEDLTLAEYILQLANDEALKVHIFTVYPVMNALTSSQRAALFLGGLAKIIEGLYQSNDHVKNRSEAIKTAIGKMKENGCDNGRLYIWTGVDTTLYSKKVVKTNALR